MDDINSIAIILCAILCYIALCFYKLLQIKNYLKGINESQHYLVCKLENEKRKDGETDGNRKQE